MGGNESVVCPDRRSLPSQISGKKAEAVRGNLVEGGNGDISDEGADEGMELLRLPEIGAIA